MKVVLILSLALVLLASASFAAPPRVLLPAYASEDIVHEKRETAVENVEQEPDNASNPYQAVEVPVDDGDQQQVVPLVSETNEGNGRKRWLITVNVNTYRMVQRTHIGNRNNVRIKHRHPRSADEEQWIVDSQEFAKAFGLTETELKELYQLWLQKVPDGEDNSFQAFTSWMEKEHEDENVKVGTRSFRDYQKWGSGKNYFGKKTKRDYAEDEQGLAGVQRSTDEEQPEINQQELATDKRNFDKWVKTVWLKAFAWKKPRALEEDEQKNIVNGSEEVETSKEKVEVESPNLSAEDTEKSKGEEEEKKIPAKETESTDTSDGYSCVKNSPCNIENIANEQFYFATESAEKFIQCDAWGGCHTLTCEDGLVWDDLIKTCGPRT